MRTTLIVFVGWIAVACTAAFAQFQQQLQDELVRHTLVLRNFYTAHKLKYDANGTLVSNSDSGVGPADGRVYVEAVQLQPTRLLIRGERPISVFNPATGDSSLLGLHEKVEIEAALPSDKPANEAARELLHRIFLTSEETNALTCSAEEQRAFRDRMLQVKEFVGTKKENKQNNELPRQLCFPDGSRAYVAGNGVVPPKALKTPDPPYPQNEPNRRENKGVVLALIVDEKGKPRSLIVIGGSATVFDLVSINAVQGWKFQPGTYQGKPVPTAINVEMNFMTQ